MSVLSPPVESASWAKEQGTIPTLVCHWAPVRKHGSTCGVVHNYLVPDWSLGCHSSDSVLLCPGLCCHSHSRRRNCRCCGSPSGRERVVDPCLCENCLFWDENERHETNEKNNLCWCLALFCLVRHSVILPSRTTCSRCLVSTSQVYLIPSAG